MISELRIKQAQDKITSLFADQCLHGSQLNLLSDDFAACGQFIGSSAKAQPQRGLHGTAAALRVFAASNQEVHNKLVRKLVNYIENRKSLFEQGIEKNADKQSFEDDQNNVIKQSEVLYALSFVTPGQCETGELRAQLAQAILNACIESKGWPYFFRHGGAPDILPTAFAILALARAGYGPRITKQIEWLKEAVLKNDSIGGDIIETSVKIFCIYALAYNSEDLAKEELRVLRRAFKKQWNAHEALMAQDLEQNIEYSQGSINYYVRIPWQLYLVALTVRLQPSLLWSITCQKRLDQILDAVLTGRGFLYPYSGGSLSSRTNAILFDTLDKVRRFNGGGLLYNTYYWIDKIRTWLSCSFVSWSSLIVVFLVIAYCVKVWFDQGVKPAELGSGLMQSFVALVASYFIERIRKPR